jgi:hypothetical protein
MAGVCREVNSPGTFTEGNGMGLLARLFTVGAVSALSASMLVVAPATADTPTLPAPVATNRASSPPDTRGDVGRLGGKRKTAKLKFKMGSGPGKKSHNVKVKRVKRGNAKRYSKVINRSRKLKVLPGRYEIIHREVQITAGTHVPKTRTQKVRARKNKVTGLSLFYTFVAAPSMGLEPKTALKWVVGMGDSYMSGEGASFAGHGPKNGLSNLSGDWWVNAFGHNLQDAFPGDFLLPIAQPGLTPAERNANSVPEFGKLCHRSGSASMHWDDPTLVSTARSGYVGINLACSGATSKTTSEKPGVDEKGQAAQLQKFAGTVQKQGGSIEYIQLSIGGNDIDFDGIVTECVEDYLDYDVPFVGGGCSKTGKKTKLNAVLADKASKAKVAVTNSGDSIIAAMDAAKVERSSYTIVVTSYTIGVPDADNFESAFKGGIAPRQNYGGCGFADNDLNAIKKKLGPTLLNATKDGASALARKYPTSNIRLIDATDAAKGHELCSKDVDYPNIGTQGQNTLSPAWSGSKPGMYGQKGAWITPVILCLQVRLTCGLESAKKQYPNLMKTLTCDPVVSTNGGCKSPTLNAKQTPLHPNYWLQRALATCHATSTSQRNHAITKCTPAASGDLDSANRPEMTSVISGSLIS